MKSIKICQINLFEARMQFGGSCSRAPSYVPELYIKNKRQSISLLVSQTSQLRGNKRIAYSHKTSFENRHYHVASYNAYNMKPSYFSPFIFLVLYYPHLIAVLRALASERSDVPQEWLKKDEFRWMSLALVSHRKGTWPQNLHHLPLVL